jgi:hypothetical protein
MDLTTPTAATGQRVISTVKGQDGFIVVVKADSPSGLRVLTGQSFKVDGVETADTTGLLIPADGSLELPPGVYCCKTATNGSAATFSAVAFVRDYVS